MERLPVEGPGLSSLTSILGEGSALRYDSQDRLRRPNGKNVVRGAASSMSSQVFLMNGWH